MKTKTLLLTALLFIFSACLLGAQESILSQSEIDKIADLLVNKILKVQPNELVIIAGNQDQTELLSATYVAVRKAGGFAYIELWLPEAGKKALMETPEEFLKQTNVFEIFKNRMVDCYIGIGSNNDPTLYADIPESKFIASNESYVLINKHTDHFRTRGVWVGQVSGVPTKVFAKSVNANYEEMFKGFWKSVNTDYEKLSKRGMLSKALLKPGGACKISSKYGTDITFTIDQIPARVNCGNIDENNLTRGQANIWLPAGEAYVCIVPGSANGKIIVPTLDFRGIKIKNLDITVKDGKIIDLKATGNIQRLKEMFDKQVGDDDVLSYIDFGLNEDSKLYKGSDFLSFEMAGMVSIGFGNNSWLGGNNDAPSGLNVFLQDASLSVDGKTIIKDGKLMLD